VKAHWICIPATALTIIVGGQASADEALAQKSGCLDCHGVDKKIIGPAFHDIAGKYKESVGARATLIAKVKMGGKGNWTKLTGGAPMPPYASRLSDAEIRQLVDWVLGR
jgi:cytochrome c